MSRDIDRRVYLPVQPFGAKCITTQTPQVPSLRSADTVCSMTSSLPVAAAKRKVVVLALVLYPSNFDGRQLRALLPGMRQLQAGQLLMSCIRPGSKGGWGCRQRDRCTCALHAPHLQLACEILNLCLVQNRRNGAADGTHGHVIDRCIWVHNEHAVPDAVPSSCWP